MPLFASKRESSLKPRKLNLVATAVAAALAFAVLPVHSIGAQTAANAVKSGATKAAASPSVNFKTLFTFNGADGDFPDGSLLRDAAGNLYGVTIGGGNAGSCTVPTGCGVVFMLDPSGKESVLYAFTGGTDGGFPVGNLVMDAEGDLYGATMGGGTASCDFGFGGCGVVYELTPPATKGAPWAETVLHAFTGADDGELPYAGLGMDDNGNIYGTTSEGGRYLFGVLFKIASNGQQSVLYSFCKVMNEFDNCESGNFPFAAPSIDKQGNVYGTTAQGGENCCEDFGGGTVYKVTQSGRESVLYTFCQVGDCTDGRYPQTGLIRDPEGDIYGTTESGGNPSIYCSGGVGCGVVFKLTPAGQETVLYAFSGGSDGEYPSSGALLRDWQGNLYGTTYAGGAGSCGTIFKVTPSGQESLLYSFTCQADGANPEYALTSDGKGGAYGTTSGGSDNAYGYGTIFEISQ